MNEGRIAEQLFELLDDKGMPVTLDENGQMETAVPEDLIPLKEWAKKNGISDATARQKAIRGALVSARKIGRDWMISASEPNTDHRLRVETKQELLLEGPVWFQQVMNYLLSLDAERLPEKWTKNNSHAEYCRQIFRSLMGKMSGNEKILFELMCEEMSRDGESSVCFIPHSLIMSKIDDEAWHTANAGSQMNEGVTIEFSDYLILLKNTIRDLLTRSIELKIHHGTQDLIMPWYHSVSWKEDRADGVYFVPSDFFRTVMAGQSC